MLPKADSIDRWYFFLLYSYMNGVCVCVHTLRQRITKWKHARCIQKFKRLLTWLREKAFVKETEAMFRMGCERARKVLYSFRRPHHTWIPKVSFSCYIFFNFCIALTHQKDKYIELKRGKQRPCVEKQKGVASSASPRFHQNTKSLRLLCSSPLLFFFPGHEENTKRLPTSMRTRRGMGRGGQILE